MKFVKIHSTLISRTFSFPFFYSFPWTNCQTRVVHRLHFFPFYSFFILHPPLT